MSQPTTTTSEKSAPEKSPKPRPYVKDSVAVFEKEIPGREPGSTKRIYELCDDATGIKYIQCPTQVLGYDLSKDNAVDLYNGHTLLVKAPKKDGSGPYPLAIGATGVKEQPGKNPQYTNRYLQVETGFPIFAEVAKGEDPFTGNVLAYVVGAGYKEKKDTKMFRFVGNKNDPIKLELGDCVNILNNGFIQKAGYKLEIREIQEVPSTKVPGEVVKTAFIKGSVISNENPNPARRSSPSIR